MPRSRPRTTVLSWSRCWWKLPCWPFDVQWKRQICLIVCNGSYQKCSSYCIHGLSILKRKYVHATSVLICIFLAI